MSLALFHDTIVAQSTPNGKSALAVVRLSGRDAISNVAALLPDPAALFALRSGGSLHSDVVEADTIDDVVIHVFRAPNSYTGQDVVEISCHGSSVIVAAIIEATQKRGARLAEPGEFSRRAFWNGKITLEQAELIPLKIESISDRELRGTERGLKEKFEVLRSAYDLLIALVAQIDAEIDFGESDEIEVRGLEESISSVIARLNALLERSATKRLNSGFYTVALVGPPNVGKSSLFNALLQTERSIVSETPGTTRDYLEAFVDIDGFPVKIVDTAGLRAAIETIEAKGIELGQAVALEADLTLRLTEPGSRDARPASHEVLVHNKADLDRWSSGVAISALTGYGLPELHSVISSRIREFASDLSRPRLLDGERERLSAVVSGLTQIDISVEAPIIAEELRSAAEEIGLLLGLTTSVESLNYIFSSMCIGK